jgi:hypothetical protein
VGALQSSPLVAGVLDAAKLNRPRLAATRAAGLEGDPR